MIRILYEIRIQHHSFYTNKLKFTIQYRTIIYKKTKRHKIYKIREKRGRIQIIRY